MGTRRPSMKYRDNINGVHVYDVVRIGRGYFKDKLAICTWVDFLKRELKLKVIDNGIDITLHKNSVDFCYHNTKSAAKQWFQTIDYNVDKLRKLWSDIKYIKTHWYEPLSHNDIAGRAIAKIVNYNVNSEERAIEFIEYWSDALNIIFAYPDVDFVLKTIDMLNVDKHYRTDIVRSIHRAAWVEDSTQSSTGEQPKLQ